MGIGLQWGRLEAVAVKHKKKSQGLHGPDLRAFKHAVSKLKAKGLVKASIDARKQRATRYMRAKVKKLAPVLQGKVSPVLRSAKIAREYKAAGFQVFNNRVLLEPHTARSVRASKSKPGEYMTVRKYVGTHGDTVIEQVILPATIRNFDQFIERIQDGEFKDLKRPEDFWAFQFYGNNSQATFATLDHMLMWLDHYKAIQADEPGAWEHFILFRVYPPGAWDTRAGPNQMARNRRRRPAAHSNDRRRSAKRVSRAALSYEDLKRVEAIQKREQRERETPERREKRLAANRNNMRANRAAKYAKRGKAKENYGNRKP